MKPFLLAFLALFLAGCGADRATHGDVQAPPSTHQTSGATEDLIAQRAAALARVKVDAANESAAKAAKRAAKSDGDRLVAKAALSAAQTQHDRDAADAKALGAAMIDQRHAEITGALDRFYYVAALLLLLAGFLAYERNLLGAGRVALAAVGLIVTAQAVTFAVMHEGLILAASVAGLVLELGWHYRSRLVSAEQALVHAVRGYPWADAEKHIQAALLAAWTRSLSAFERLEVLLHIHAKPVVPSAPATTTNPPAG